MLQKTHADKECHQVAKGGYLPCLMELAMYNGEEEEEDKEENKNCFQFLRRMQQVIFR